MRLYYQIKILFRVNILLGLFHFIRKRLSKKIIISAIEIPRIIDLYPINQNFSASADLFIQSDKKAQLLQGANDFINGKIKIYGHTVSLSDYTIDKFNQNRSKKEIYNRDVRFQWEIYRGRFLFNIGLAYHLTKDEKYALALVEYIKAWKDYSPATDSKLKYNGMESALKLMNLSLLDPLLKDSPHYTQATQDELITALTFHAEYTYRNYDITFYGLESNHGMSCAIGLIYAAHLFPDYSNARKWQKLGFRALRRALKKQFTPDGVNFESSVNYHRFVFELLIFLLAALYRQNIKVDPFIEESIRRIGNSLRNLTHSNNMISRFGDSDGGKFLPDLNSLDDFNRMEYLEWFTSSRKSNFLETIMFSDLTQFDHFLNNNHKNGVAGSYISFKEEDISLIISANEIGTYGKGNHQHNDFMSFELHGKSPFILDPWSYCYTGDPNLRNEDRATKRHNTIMLDGREIVEYDEERIFEMMKNISVKIIYTGSDDNHWITELEHNGYRNLVNGSQYHNRKFEYNRLKQELTIIDRLNGTGLHEARINFHIQKNEWHLRVEDEDCVFSNDVEMFIVSNSVGKFIVQENYVSSGFLLKEPSYYLYLDKEYESNMVMVTKIRYRALAN